MQKTLEDAAPTLAFVRKTYSWETVSNKNKKIVGTHTLVL